MEQEPLTSGSAYALYLLGRWQEILELGQRVRFNILTNSPDKKTHLEYIAKLVTLRQALYAKVKGNKELGADLEERYKELKEVSTDVLLFTHKENLMRIFDLEEVLAETLEKLGITQFKDQVI